MLRALQQGPFDPLQTVELKFLSDSAPACIGLHQEGRGPARIFGRWFVPRVWAGPGNPKAPAWLCAQGSHYSLQGPGGEPASAALGGGRPSLSFALSRPSIEMLRWQDAKLQDLRPALYLSRRPAEGNAVSKQRMAHWIVDCHHPGLLGTGCALPVQVESPLY